MAEASPGDRDLNGVLQMTRSDGAGTSTVDVATIRRVVELARQAPSVYNTQPWEWRPHSGGLVLRADRSRALLAADPIGRNLVISCGAALHHAQVAALALGWAPSVRRFPDPGDPDLLAEIRLTPVTPPRQSAGELAALLSRYTDRRRFTSWPVPVGRLEGLVRVAEEWDTRGHAVGDLTDKFRLEMLISRALRIQSRDEAILAELRAWQDRPDAAGIPSNTVPDRPGPDPSHLTRFGSGTLEDAGRDMDGTDGLIVLGDDQDVPAAWLRCGEGLSALWLRATQEGLSVVPLTQVVEVPETRLEVGHEVLHGAFVPLLVVRVGWQAISRRQVPKTPRRTLEDVLRT